MHNAQAIPDRDRKKLKSIRQMKGGVSNVFVTSQKGEGNGKTSQNGSTSPGSEGTEAKQCP